MGEIRQLERRIKRVESILIGLTIAAIASGDYLYGPFVTLGYLYLIPLSYSALAHRWTVTLVLVTVCVGLREWLGPLEYSSWGLIARDWALTVIFLGVVTALHRLGTARSAFFEEARAQRDELLREVQMAAAVQRHLLDRHVPPTGLLDAVARTEPAKEVGGDYYDFFPVDEHRFGVVIADVAGKGLPAALIMPAVQIATRTLASRHPRIEDVLRELNDVFFEALEPSSYTTLVYALIDVKARTLIYANAGHQPVLHYRARTAEGHWLRQGGTPVGLLPGAEYETDDVSPQPGDVFVFFTDGVVEARNPAGEEFGEDRLLAIVQDNAHDTAEALVSRIHSTVDGFRSRQQRADDTTVIVLKVTGEE